MNKNKKASHMIFWGGKPKQDFVEKIVLASGNLPFHCAFLNTHKQVVDRLNLSLLNGGSHFENNKTKGQNHDLLDFVYLS